MPHRECVKPLARSFPIVTSVIFDCVYRDVSCLSTVAIHGPRQILLLVLMWEVWVPENFTAEHRLRAGS